MIDVGTDVEPLIKAFRERNVAVGRKLPAMPQWLRIPRSARRRRRGPSWRRCE